MQQKRPVGQQQEVVNLQNLSLQEKPFLKKSFTSIYTTLVRPIRFQLSSPSQSISGNVYIRQLAHLACTVQPVQWNDQRPSRF